MANFSNLFKIAEESKTKTEELILKEKTFETIFEKNDFKLQINGTESVLRFVRKNEPNEELVQELEKEIESLKKDYNNDIKVFSSQDEEMKKRKIDIYKKECALQRAQGEDSYSGYYIKNKKFTEEMISTIAGIILAPGKKCTLMSVVYRLGASLAINGEYKQADVSDLPSFALVSCESWVENYQANKIDAWVARAEADRLEAEETQYESDIEDEVPFSYL